MFIRMPIARPLKTSARWPALAKMMTLPHDANKNCLLTLASVVW
jgi:hypothetical protein